MSEPLSSEDRETLSQLLAGKIFVYEMWNSYTQMPTCRLELEVFPNGEFVNVNIKESDFGSGGLSEPRISYTNNVKAEVIEIVNGKIALKFCEKYGSGIGEELYFDVEKSEFAFVSYT